MAQYWLSKTHVRIESAEMTRDEAVNFAKELLAELDPPFSRRYVSWTDELQRELQKHRKAGLSIRQIAKLLLGDERKVGAISGRIKRMGLPVKEARRRSGQVAAAVRWAK
jgi:hypothetical protein